ncbi:Pre-mRNA-processing factor 39 [Hordeum vulgare]|nr:Pre-mRNA-processing factor 39 [Hordeum vulgare]
MVLFSDADSSKAKGKSPAAPFPSEFLLPPPATDCWLRQRINVPVHQVEWHWQHHVPLPYPDATLPHDWHLDSETISVLTAPRSARAHAEEHEEVRRRGIREVDRTVPPPPLVVREEDQATEATYQTALAAVYRESKEDERRRAAAGEQEEAAYEAAMALSAAGECVLPLVTPPCPVNAEPEPEPIERYSWTGVVHEWVSVPPVWVGATPTQEAAHLEHWR